MGRALFVTLAEDSKFRWKKHYKFQQFITCLRIQQQIPMRSKAWKNWLWYMSYTYSCKSIDPFWYFISCKLVTHILTKMVAVLHNQVISIAIVVCWLLLHELSNLERIQACCSHEYWLPKLKPRALPGFNLKDTTCRKVMSSKCIFYSMNCNYNNVISRYFQRIQIHSNQRRNYYEIG